MLNGIPDFAENPVSEEDIKRWWARAEYDCTNSASREIVRAMFDDKRSLDSASNERIALAFYYIRGKFKIWRSLPQDRSFYRSRLALTEDSVSGWHGWQHPGTPAGYIPWNLDLLLLCSPSSADTVVLDGNHRLSSWFYTDPSPISVDCYLCVVDRIPDYFLAFDSY